MVGSAEVTQSQSEQRPTNKWGMVVDLDKCTGCRACVIACQAENNVPINEESAYHEGRAISWIRVERYWEGEFPNVKTRFIPLMCQHCDNAPCEPVCPVAAIFAEDAVPENEKEYIPLNYNFPYPS